VKTFPVPERPERLYNVNVRADKRNLPIKFYRREENCLQVSNRQALQHVRHLLKYVVNNIFSFCEHNTFIKCVFVTQLSSNVGILVQSIRIIEANKMHYFSTLFWYTTLRVSDRLTVHHEESWYCIHSNLYLPYYLCWLSASRVNININI
jgi:hypothetical protein